MLMKGRKGLKKVELPFGSLMSRWKACQPYLHFNLHASLYKTLYSGSALKYLSISFTIIAMTFTFLPPLPSGAAAPAH